ncbi:MAG TPA: cytochrome b/b6 domain-containing protein [Bordetella sp.]|nr:cytochrome b/b6 domain-containing protein [Bordetella sp.]
MSRTQAGHWPDSPQGYGSVTRYLHWAMAALFAWQFTSSALHAWNREAGISRWFWSSHVSLGVLLLALVAVRAVWALENQRRRPSNDANLWGRLSTAGHAGLYVLMFCVPLIAMLRAYGRGKGLAVLGVPLFDASGREISLLVELGNALHGWLGWLLLALVAGHIAMVGVHQYVWRDQIAARMLRRR